MNAWTYLICRTVSTPGQPPMTNLATFIPNGMTSFEISIAVAFFQAYPSDPVFFFGLEAFNGQNTKGKNWNHSLKINKKIKVSGL